MENKIKLSVIIPVYNGEKHIKKCLSGLLSQTRLNDVEIIVVNDGSLDNTETIVNEFINENETVNINLINQKNGGVGNARNTGIQYASGKYITFLDSDDRLQNDFFSVLLDNMQNYDILVSGVNWVDEYNNINFTKIPTENNETQKYNYLVCYGKLYNRLKIVENNIKFSGLKIAEDAIWSVETYYLLDNVCMIEYSGYNYFENPSSVMRDKRAIKENPIINILKEYNRILESYKINENEIDNLLYCMKKSNAFFIMKKINLVNKKKVYEELKTCMEYIENITRKYNKKLRIDYNKHEIISTNICVNLITLLYKMHLLKLYIIIAKRIKNI